MPLAKIKTDTQTITICVSVQKSTIELKLLPQEHPKQQPL